MSVHQRPSTFRRHQERSCIHMALLTKCVDTLSPLSLSCRMTGNLIPIAPCPKCGNKLTLVVTPSSYQSPTFECFNCNRPLSLRRDKAPDSPQPCPIAVT